MQACASLRAVRFRSIALGLVALSAFSWTAPARADDTLSNLELARQAYARGELATGQHDYEGAARAFAEADRLAPNPTALESALGAAIQADDARLGMELVARSRRDAASSSLAVVEKAREKFARRVGAIEIRCAKPPCSAKVDGASATGTVWVDVGKHQVVFAVGGHDSPLDADVQAEERLVVTQPPPPAEGVAPAPVVVVREPVDRPRSSGGISPWWFVGGAAITAGLAAGTIASAVDTSHIHDDFDAVKSKGPTAEGDRLKSSGESASVRTYVLIGVTSAAAVATAAVGIFAVKWRSDGPVKTVSLSPSPGGLSASGRF